MNEKIGEIEKEVFESKIKAMSPEEQKIAAGLIDIDIMWDELRRRETAERNKIQAMAELFGSEVDKK